MAATRSVAGFVSAIRTGNDSPIRRSPASANTRLTATASPRTPSSEPRTTSGSSVRPVRAPLSAAAGHGLWSPSAASTGWTSVDATAVTAVTPSSPATSAAEAAGSGAPPLPTTIREAWTRSRVTSSVWRWLLDSTTPWMPTSIVTSTIGVARAAVRQRFAASPVPASSPAAPRRRSGTPRSAAGNPSSQRPSSPTPMASTIPPRIANTIAQKPENTRAIATPPSRNAAPASVRTNPGRGCSIATSRNASAGGMRPARRAAAATASWPIRTPMPSAAAIGISDAPGANAGPTSPRSARTPTMASASGRPAASPSAPAASDTISASPASRRRTWWGVAPSARRTAVSRRRCAIARANVPATTNSAMAPAMPPSAPKIAISPARSAAVGSPASAFAAWSRSRTSMSRPRRSRSSARRPAAGVPGSAITPIAFTRPGAPASRPASASRKNSAAWLGSPAPRASASPLTR